MRQKALEYTRVVLRLAVVALAVSLPLMAQVGGGVSPFAGTLNALQIFMTGVFARSMAIVAIVLAGWELISGQGHHHKIAQSVLGIGTMVLAIQILSWLFGI